MEITENSILEICLEKELQRYELDGKWNDYIAVQKEVLRVLRANNFFDDNLVVNQESGMMIKVTPKGIKETFGNGKRFNTMPKEVKKWKIATIYCIKKILQNAHLLEYNIKSIHSTDTSTYAYFKTKISIDNSILIIRITVKQKIGSNIFYIHHIDNK